MLCRLCLIAIAYKISANTPRTRWLALVTLDTSSLACQATTADLGLAEAIKALLGSGVPSWDQLDGDEQGPCRNEGRRMIGRHEEGGEYGSVKRVSDYRAGFLYRHMRRQQFRAEN